MKRVVPIVLAVLAAASLSLAAPVAKKYTGEIMDSQCAMLGSHDAMMKSMHAPNARECTIQCAKMGGKYVLYNNAEKKTYQLDNQKMPADFAGGKVTVTGELNGKVIQVEKIEPAP